MNLKTQTKVSSIDGDFGAVRKAFAQFPSGVAVLAVDLAGAKHALVASSFMVGVSLEPCLVAIAVQKTSESWNLIKDSGLIGVSVFGRGQGHLTRKLAGKDRAKRFEQVASDVGERGSVFLEDAALWLECSVHEVSGAGDHWMVLLEVEKLGVGRNEPLVWHDARFRELAAAETIDVE
jgi:flavin reductase (DIM6/NTAB) family NADH-FMN oxidoreductase RutF